MRKYIKVHLKIDSFVMRISHLFVSYFFKKCQKLKLYEYIIMGNIK